MACTRAALITNGTCFTQQMVGGEHNQSAAMVYLLVKILATAGGTNYINGVTGILDTTTLFADANSATCGMNDDQLTAAIIGSMNNIPTGTFYSFITFEPLTPAAIASAISCLKNFSDFQYKQMTVYLICASLNEIDS